MRTGPIKLFGVANQCSVSEYGIYAVSLALHDGKNAVVSGIFVDLITAVFPTYPLKGKVENDIQEAYKSSGQKKNLPRLPNDVGGATDLMIGSQYFVYSPKLVFELPRGLSL